MSQPHPADPPPSAAPEGAHAPIDRRAAGVVVLAMLAFSFMPAFTRAAAAPVLGVSAWRALFVCLSFVVAAALREREALRRPTPEALRLGLLLGGAQALASATFVGGYALTTVANTVFLHNLAPLAVFPLAWFSFGERPRPAAIAGVAVAVLGVGLLSGLSLFQVAHFASARFLLGDGLALLSGLGYAGVLVITRASRRAGAPLFTTLAIAWAVAAVVLGLIALLAGDLWIGGPALGWTLGLALLSTTLPFALLNHGLGRLGAGTVSVLSLAEVLFATAQGVLFFGEALSPLGWLGGALVAAGVLYALGGEGPADGAAVEAGPSPALRSARAWRLGGALLCLNAAAVLALTDPGSGAHLLAVAAALALARLGPSLARLGAGPALQRVVGGGAAVVAAAAVVGLVSRGVMVSAPSWPTLILVISALAVDVALAGREPAAERDPLLPLRLGALGLAAAQALALAGHPRADVAAALGALCIVLAAAAPIAAAAAGGGPPRGPAVEREAALAPLLRPRALVPAALALWLSGGLSAVQPGERAVVERFGAPQGAVRAPGLAVHAPPPIDQLRRVEVGRARRAALLEGGGLVLCGDQSLLSLDANLHYEIDDPKAFLYGVDDPEAVLVELGRAAVLERVAGRSHEDLLTTGRAAVEADVLADLRAASAQVGLGVRVRGVQLGAVRVPAPALGAFLEVISAAEARETAINQAEAYAAGLLPAAGGAALTRTAAAHAHARGRLAQARADAALLEAWSTGGAGAAALTLQRLRLEGLERAWTGHRLLVLPAGVQLEGALPAPPAPPR
ncbi:MAG: EamA family transporter [Deltaproteobacteria bacterium]|nr:EamA family transporter [Deltaproteobacteria bacterium]